MKKRVKLLTTIASLCLAVALMAFGVYAATSGIVTVSSKVSFDIGAHLDGTVTITAYLSADNKYDAGVDTIIGTAQTATFKATDDKATNDAKTITMPDATLTQETPYVVYVISYAPANGVNADLVVTKPTVPTNYTSAETTEATENAGLTWVKASDTFTADDEGGDIQFTVSLTGK